MPAREQPRRPTPPSPPHLSGPGAEVSADVALALEGDREAQGRLWRLHRRWIGAVLVAGGARRDELEDVLQDVAVAVVDRFDSLREPAALRGWLRRIALNELAGARRRTGRREPTGDEVGEPATPSTSRRHDVEEVLREARSLDDELREPLLLRALGGLTQREIADALGVPETTVETRLVRARRRLRERLARRNPTRLEV